MLRLHQETANGTGGVGVWPERGGLFDQAEIVVQALDYLRMLHGPVLVPVQLMTRRGAGDED